MGLYIITCIAVAVSYVWNLIWFMRLLAPEGIIRLDPDKIAGADLDSCSAHETERRLIRMYRSIINKDLAKLHARCDRFVRGLRYVPHAGPDSFGHGAWYIADIYTVIPCFLIYYY